jgi:two-component system repressor protein LuxO
MEQHKDISSLPTLLLVDDDINILQALKRALHNIKANIIDFSSPVTALEYCQHNQPDVVISDQHMPGMNGCEFLEHIKQRWPNSQRIILSAHQDFDLVSAAFSSGVVEKYICKPWVNKELNFVVDKALNRDVGLTITSEANNNTSLSGLIKFHGIVAEDAAMHELF